MDGTETHPETGHQDGKEAPWLLVVALAVPHGGEATCETVWMTKMIVKVVEISR
jgi:hypothetical protein